MLMMLELRQFTSMWIAGNIKTRDQTSSTESLLSSRVLPSSLSMMLPSQRKIGKGYRAYSKVSKLTTPSKLDSLGSGLTQCIT